MKNKLSIFGQYEPKEFPPNIFPEIYNIINDFKNRYKDPFVDFFYFIIIVSERCRYCRTFFNAYSKISSVLSLDNNNKNNIISLIKNYFGKKEINQSRQCICGYYGKIVEEKVFYNSPNYLVLDLNENKEGVTLDDQLDLSEFSKEDKIIRYELYATINKDIDLNYVCSIRNKKGWTFYNECSIQKCGVECLECGIPSFVIYKKIINIK